MAEIEIRPALAPDLKQLADIDPAYTSSFVWQMERTMDDEGISVRFREIRLPRPIRVEYPRPVDEMAGQLPKDAVLLVAKNDDTQFGYIRFRTEHAAQTVWITDIVVQEKVRRKGIASALILSVKEWCETRGFRKIVIEMQSKNHPTIKMCMKFGFEFCGYQDQYYPNRDLAVFFMRTLR
ncbi:MAG: GNAT family N-acetyltransferase [Anaerolineae bacterium]|nr:GNAT family N-acetyltransferase [Anaerolineae bacterium]